MKSYLSLIPISAKVHRRQNRMTLLCIIFAVFMVTAVFSMAEMGVRMEYTRLVGKHGSLSTADMLGSGMGQTLLLTACILFLLILYDDFDLQCLKKDGALKRGSGLKKVYGNSSFVLAASDADSAWRIGDTVHINGETLTIAGLLKNDPFSEDGLTHGKLTLISSGETFVRLTGEEDYALVMVQTTGGATNADVRAIQAAAGKTFSFRDMREARTSGTYMAFVFCVYAFLAIIALVTVLNIVNSISMSVWARMKQYGAMRAVGMDGRQMTKMIAAEAATYAALGCAAGCAIGLPLSRLIYNMLIDGRFPYAVWCFPLRPLVMIA